MVVVEVTTINVVVPVALAAAVCAVKTKTAMIRPPTKQ
jgi:hypothetical protein